MSYHQKIYNLLRGYGLSEAGALGMLGNWECESGCEPYRVQGDYQASRAISKAYVNAIESGMSDKQRFSNDQKGFGLAQWTYFSRKGNLWKWWEGSEYRIDSVEFQVWFAIWELTNEYSSLLYYLKTTTDIQEACSRICKEYERPAVNNVQARYEAALRIRSEIDLSGTVSNSETVDEDHIVDVTKKLETWPPRTIDEHCTGWAEVWLLQSLLKCRGFNALYDGIWGNVLTDKVKQFQKENNLDADGVVGKNTWIKLGIDPVVFEGR